jgi:negative regulator of flagellin synthesis FlgM
MPDPIRGVDPAEALGVASTGQAGPAQPARPPGESSSPTGVDSADVNRAEALLAAITQAADAVPALDQARIAELQQAIASGTYKVDPMLIAQKIVELEALLGVKGKAG